MLRSQTIPGGYPALTRYSLSTTELYHVSGLHLNTTLQKWEGMKGNSVMVLPDILTSGILTPNDSRAKASVKHSGRVTFPMLESYTPFLFSYTDLLTVKV